MEKNCSVNMVKDLGTMPNVDAWLKQAAAELKAGGRRKTG
jgi:hypothetical protein